MTGFLRKEEFSRRSFLKGGGALVVGFSFAGAGLAGKANATDSPFASNGPYDSFAVDTYIRINADNTAAIITGRGEFGQGSSTGMLQIAGEELDMDMSQLNFVVADTNVTPKTYSGGSSSSIRRVGPSIRAAAATARKTLLGLASTSLGVPVAALTVKSGVVSGGGKSVTYGQLLGDKLFNVSMPASYNLTAATWNDNLATAGLLAGAPGTKPISQYTLVGTRVPRLDIPEKVIGTHTYVHNVRVPGMLHGRVVRPRGQGAYGSGAQIVSVDETSIKHIPGVQVVRKGDLLGVVAPKEYDAIQAAAQLKVTWADPPKMSGSGNIWKQMREDDAAGLSVNYVRVTNDYPYHNVNPDKVDAALNAAAHVVSHTYSYGYDAHAVIGPSCCVADVTSNGAIVFINTQEVYGTRTAVANALGLPEKAVRVKFYEGSSSYGSAPYTEAAEAAAVMSQVVGKPVRLQYMRWDEHGWDNYGPALMIDLRGGIDANGKLVATDHTVFSRPDASTDVVNQQIGTPLQPQGTATGMGHWGITGSQYTIPNRRTIGKSLPSAGYGLKTGSMRSVLGPQEAFAYEQMIDELAYAAKMDPYLFRVQNVWTIDNPDLPWFSTERWLGVMNATAKAANWKPKVAASNLSDANVVAGRGIAVAPHAMSLSTVVADIEVNKKTGKIVPKHLYMAVNTGLTINPGLLENQMIGGSVMAVSRVLLEEVRFNTSRVTSLDWVSYPILRFKDHPAVTAIVIQTPDQHSGGAGEVPEAATVAAVANAFFDATGVRIREAPLTPARVRAALKASGVA